VSIRLESPREYRVWALAPSGKRLADMPATVEAGSLRFTADVAGDQASGARMLYEVAVNDLGCPSPQWEEGRDENAPTVVALGTLEPKRADASDCPQRAGTRRRALTSARATPAPPSPLNGERAG